LRKNDHKKLTDLVRRLPGVRIKCGVTGPRRGECWANSGRQATRLAILGGECDVDVYIDDVVSTDYDLEKIEVNRLGGVEFYAGGASLPTKYNRTGSSCGVLLIWTRER
jgi:hypothetical protein